MPAAKMAIRRMFHAEGPQLLGSSVNNFVAQATWGPRFVHPCSIRHYLWTWSEISREFSKYRCAGTRKYRII